MKFATTLLNSLLLIVVLSGCTSTIIPKIVTNNGGSWDDGERNSGFIGFYTNQSQVAYGVITPHARDRYNNLIENYGNLIHTLTKDYGITDNGTNFYISLEALADFAKMNRWHKQDFKP